MGHAWFRLTLALVNFVLVMKCLEVLSQGVCNASTRISISRLHVDMQIDAESSGTPEFEYESPEGEEYEGHEYEAATSPTTRPTARPTSSTPSPLPTTMPLASPTATTSPTTRLASPTARPTTSPSGILKGILAVNLPFPFTRKLNVENSPSCLSLGRVPFSRTVEFRTQFPSSFRLYENGDNPELLVIYDASGCEISCQKLHAPFGRTLHDNRHIVHFPHPGVYYMLFLYTGGVSSLHSDIARDVKIVRTSITMEKCLPHFAPTFISERLILNQEFTPVAGAHVVLGDPPSCYPYNGAVELGVYRFTVPLDSNTTKADLLLVNPRQDDLYCAILDVDGCVLECMKVYGSDFTIVQGLIRGQSYTFLFMNDVIGERNTSLVVSLVHVPTITAVLDATRPRTFISNGLLSVFTFVRDPAVASDAEWLINVEHVNQGQGWLVEGFLGSEFSGFYWDWSLNWVGAFQESRAIENGKFLAIVLYRPGANLTITPVVSNWIIPTISDIVALPYDQVTTLPDISAIVNSSSTWCAKILSSGLFSLERSFRFRARTDLGHVLWLNWNSGIHEARRFVLVFDMDGHMQECYDSSMMGDNRNVLLSKLVPGRDYYIGLLSISRATQAIEALISVVTGEYETPECVNPPIQSQQITRISVDRDVFLETQDMSHLDQASSFSLSTVLLPKRPHHTDFFDGLQVYQAEIMVPATMSFVMTSEQYWKTNIHDSRGCLIASSNNGQVDYIPVQFDLIAAEVYTLTAWVHYTLEGALLSVHPKCRAAVDLVPIEPFPLARLNEVLEVQSKENFTLFISSNCLVRAKQLLRFRLNDFAERPTNLILHGHAGAFILDGSTGCEVLCFPPWTTMTEASLSLLDPSKEYLLGVQDEIREKQHPTYVALISANCPIEARYSPSKPVVDLDGFGNNTIALSLRNFEMKETHKWLTPSPCRTNAEYFSKNMVMWVRASRPGRYRFSLEGYGVDIISIHDANSGCELKCSNVRDVSHVFTQAGEIVSIVVSKRAITGNYCAPYCPVVTNIPEELNVYDPENQPRVEHRFVIFNMDTNPKVLISIETIPVVVSTVFSPSLRSMLVNFSAPITIQSSTAVNFASFPCSSVFTPESIRLMSSSSIVPIKSPDCKLDGNNQRLIAFFDVVRSQLVIGSELYFQPIVLKSSSSSATDPIFVNHSIPILVQSSPALPSPQPRIIVASATQLSQFCGDELLLELDDSIGSAGKKFVDIQWIISGSPAAGVVATIIRRNSLNLIDKPTQHVKADIRVPVRDLPVGNFSLASVTLRNWLGHEHTVVLNVSFSVIDKVATQRVLLVRTVCPQGVTNRNGNRSFETVEAFIKFRACTSSLVEEEIEAVDVFSQAPVLWRWEVDGVVAQRNFSVERFQSFLMIDDSELLSQPQTLVRVTAELYDPISQTTLISSSNCTITKASRVSIPTITGGDRSVSILFEAEVSLKRVGFEGGPSSPLWICRHIAPGSSDALEQVPCPPTIFAQPFDPTNDTVLVNVSAMVENTTYYFALLNTDVEAFLVRNERPPNESFQLDIVASDDQDYPINSAPISTSSRLRLKTSLRRGGDNSTSAPPPSFEWTLFDDTGSVTKLPDDIDVTQPHLTLPLQSLSVEGMQTFTFRVQLKELGQFATITFTLNAPPARGSLEITDPKLINSDVNPLIRFDSLVDFSLRAVHFEDDQLPLRYMFGFAPCPQNGAFELNDEALMVPLTPTFFLSNRMTTKLPSGNHMFLVRVRDDLGAVATPVIAESCVVVAANESSEGNVDDRLLASIENVTAETFRDALALATLSSGSSASIQLALLSLAETALAVASRETAWFSTQQNLIQEVALRLDETIVYEQALSSSLTIQDRLFGFLKALPSHRVVVDDEAVSVRTVSLKSLETASALLEYTSVGDPATLNVSIPLEGETNVSYLSPRELVTQIQKVNLLRALPGDPPIVIPSKLVNISLLTTTAESLVDPPSSGPASKTLFDRFRIDKTQPAESSQETLHIATGVFQRDPFRLLTTRAIQSEVVFLEFVEDSELNEVKLPFLNVTILFGPITTQTADRDQDQQQQVQDGEGKSFSDLRCGFFDHQELVWSTFGCTLSSSVEDPALMVCECNHTSDYAVWLQDVQLTLNADFTDISNGYVIVICIVVLLLGAVVLYYIAIEEDRKELDRRIQILLFATRLRQHVVPERYFKLLLMALENSSRVNYKELENFDEALCETDPSTARPQLSAILQVPNRNRCCGMERFKDFVFCMALMKKHRLLSTVFVFDPFLTRSRRVVVGALFILSQMFVNALFFTFRFTDDPDQFFFGTLIVVSIISILVVSSFMILVAFTLRRTSTSLASTSKGNRKVYYYHLMVIFLCEWMAAERHEKSVAAWIRFAHDSLSWESVEIVHRYQQLKRILREKKRLRKQKHDAWMAAALNELDDEIFMLEKELDDAHTDLLTSLGDPTQTKQLGLKGRMRKNPSSNNQNSDSGEIGVDRPLPKDAGKRQTITLESHFDPVTRHVMEGRNPGSKSLVRNTGAMIVNSLNSRAGLQDNAIHPSPPTWNCSHKTMMNLLIVLLIAYVFLALYYILAFGFSKTNAIVLGWIPTLALSIFLDTMIIQPLMIMLFFIVWRKIEQTWLDPNDEDDDEDDDEERMMSKTITEGESSGFPTSDNKKGTVPAAETHLPQASTVIVEPDKLSDDVIPPIEPSDIEAGASFLLDHQTHMNRTNGKEAASVVAENGSTVGGDDALANV